MTALYYVVYNPARNQYRNDAGEFGSFEDAERFDRPGEISIEDGFSRVVGPCREREEP